MEALTVNLGQYTPDDVLPVDPEFAEDFARAVEEGQRLAATRRVCFVGMARSIGGILPTTIGRMMQIAAAFKDWKAVVVENDSNDDTKEVLAAWANQSGGRVLADCNNMGHEHLHGFEALRVQRYADLRNRYRTLSQDFAPEADYVIAMDLDAWGGYSVAGVLHSVAMLEANAIAACMASTSLYRARTDAGHLVWGHYDLWALRHYGTRVRFEAWQPLWLPPPGAYPIRVYSAFGALAVYRPKALWSCQYVSNDGDIEHVGLHSNMRALGWEIYLNPASRVVMHWLQGIDLPEG